MDIYGLIGFPLGHSFSRKFFMEKFAKEHIEAEYRNFEIADVRQLSDIVRNTPNLRGLNCTIPHKQSILPLLDELDERAQRIGAVNVVKVMKDGRLKGYNADVIGFRDSIRPLILPYHRHALLLGTGGASLAVRAGLEELGLTCTDVSRTSRKGALTYEELTPEVMRKHQVIVNCSPVGMYPHIDEAPALPYELLTPNHLLYDLVYNPLQTAFMQRGEAYGAVTKNGLEMLHLQALASWDIWNQE